MGEPLLPYHGESLIGLFVLRSGCWGGGMPRCGVLTRPGGPF